MRQYCSSCLYPQKTCLCDHIVRIMNPTAIKILQHPKEAKHALNTARIASLCLQNIDIRSSFLAPQEYDNWLKNTALIFPQTHSKPLPKDHHGSLSFIDATWPKARGILQYIPILKTLPCYHLTSKTGEYQIRKAPNKTHLSTIEAIFSALSFIESDPIRYQPLLHAFRKRIAIQIEHMGMDVFTKNYLS